MKFDQFVSLLVGIKNALPVGTNPDVIIENDMLPEPSKSFCISMTSKDSEEEGDLAYIPCYLNPNCNEPVLTKDFSEMTDLESIEFFGVVE